jgi:hypothetical protein
VLSKKARSVGESSTIKIFLIGIMVFLTQWMLVQKSVNRFSRNNTKLGAR